MLVNLSFTLINPSWKNQNTSGTNEELIHKFLKSKFSSLNKKVHRNMLLGFQHLRVFNLYYNCGNEILSTALDSMDYSRNIFRNYPMSFSIHTLYWCHALNSHSIASIINYYKNLEVITDYLGLTNIHFCTHLVYRDEMEASEYFYQLLGAVDKVSKCLCIENGDKSRNVLDCLRFCSMFDIPFIFDNHHNKLNGFQNLASIIGEIEKTWRNTTLTPKIHYSNGVSYSHSDFLDDKELFEILDIYKYYFDCLTVVVELIEPQKVIAAFKHRHLFDLDWVNEFTFDYN